MALNPDALNLNYDSDDSMQVDSDNDHGDHRPIPNHLAHVQDPEPDVDAEGEVEYVDDTTSAALETPVAGPSSYAHRLSDVEDSGYEDNPADDEDDDEDEDDGSYADDEYGKKKAAKSKKKKAIPSSSAPRPKGQWIFVIFYVVPS